MFYESLFIILSCAFIKCFPISEEPIYIGFAFQYIPSIDTDDLLLIIQHFPELCFHKMQLISSGANKYRFYFFCIYHLLTSKETNKH